jgi:Outer membrane protein beta-barrel domain
MRNLVYRFLPKAALLLAAFAATSHTSFAQAVATGERGAEITPFVLSTVVSPDYGQAHNLGYTVGVDYTRFIRSIVQPSIEFRYIHASGSQVNETSFGGGLNLQTTIRNIHPYATLLIGQGNITFNNAGPLNSRIDHSTAYSFGGGADFNVARQWKVRADFLSQHWNLDPGSLTPSTLAVGVAYIIPFHRGGAR